MAVPAWLHRILLTQGHDVTLAAVQAAARIVSDHVGMHKVYGPMANHVIKLVARGKVLDYAIRVKADAQARKNKGCGRPYSTPAWLKQGVAPLSLPAVEEDVAIYHERLLAMGHKVSLDAVEAGVRLLVRPQAEGPLFDLLVELFVKIITEHSAHVEAAEQRTLEGLWRDWRREEEAAAGQPETENEDVSDDPYQVKCGQCGLVFDADGRWATCGCGGCAHMTEEGKLLRAIADSPLVAHALDGHGGALQERARRAFEVLTEDLVTKARHLASLAGFDEGEASRRYRERLEQEWTRGLDELRTAAGLVWDLVYAAESLDEDLEALEGDPDSEVAARARRRCRHVFVAGPNECPGGRIHWQDLVLWRGNGSVLDDQKKRARALHHFRLVGDLPDLWLLEADDLDDEALIWGICYSRLTPQVHQIDWTGLPIPTPKRPLTDPCPRCRVTLAPLYAGDSSEAIYYCTKCRQSYVHLVHGLREQGAWMGQVCWFRSLGEQVAGAVRESVNTSWQGQDDLPPQIDVALRRQLRQLLWHLRQCELTLADRSALINEACEAAAQRWRDLAVN